MFYPTRVRFFFSCGTELVYKSIRLFILEQKYQQLKYISFTFYTFKKSLDLRHDTGFISIHIMV